MNKVINPFEIDTKSKWPYQSKTGGSISFSKCTAPKKKGNNKIEKMAQLNIPLRNKTHPTIHFMYVSPFCISNMSQVKKHYHTVIITKKLLENVSTRKQTHKHCKTTCINFRPMPLVFLYLCSLNSNLTQFRVLNRTHSSTCFCYRFLKRTRILIPFFVMGHLALSTPRHNLNM